MRLLIIILTFSLSINLFAQTKLEIDNGIKPFQFEEEKKDWEKFMYETLRISYGQSYYRYTGDQITTRFNLKVHAVNLGFFKDKLNYIDLYFKALDDFAFLGLLTLVKEEYGEPEKFLNETDPTVLEAYRWPGNNTKLELVRYNGQTADWDDRHMTVLSAKKETE